MKKIFLGFLILFANLAISQGGSYPRNDENKFNYIERLGSVFKIDTTNTFNGTTIIANNYDNFRLIKDTLIGNYGVYYIGKYNSFANTRDSASKLADTILYRSFPLYIENNSRLVYDTIIQTIGFYWKKSYGLPSNSFLLPAENAKGQSVNCIHYTPKTSWQALLNQKADLCESIEICNYTGIDNLQVFCSGKVYTKIFEDNFDDYGNGVGINGGLNMNYWRILAPQAVDGRTLGRGWNAKNMVKVNNGTLKLTCQKQQLPYTDNDVFDPVMWPNGNSVKPSQCDYLDAVVTTNFKVGYGKFQIRAKIPPILGLNPSYWLFGDQTEIDGFEFFNELKGREPKMTVYSTKNNPINECNRAYPNGNTNMFRIFETTGGSNVWQTLPNLTDGNFRVYTLVYDPMYIAWFVEEENPYKRWSLVYYNKFQQGGVSIDPNQNCTCINCSIQRNENFPDHLTQGVSLTLQMAANNTRNWAQVATAGPQTSAVMEIDWVKIYQIDNCGTDILISSGILTNNSVYAIDNTNCLTGDNITLGGVDASNPLVIKQSQNNWTPSPLQSDMPIFARANNEVRLLNGFVAEEYCLFEATNALRGNPSDCNNLTYLPQYGRLGNNQTINTTQQNIVKNSNAKIIDNLNSIKIFPNPSTGIYQIQMANDEEYFIEVYNIYGAKIQSGSFVGKQYKINIENEANGIYMVVIRNNKNINEVSKIIKE